MPLQAETERRRKVSASDQFASNFERALWAAHVRAAQLLDDEPGPVARDILNAVDVRWRRVFLEVCR